jgi:hypothetical protein
MKLKQKNNKLFTRLNWQTKLIAEEKQVVESIEVVDEVIWKLEQFVNSTEVSEITLVDKWDEEQVNESIEFNEEVKAKEEPFVESTGVIGCVNCRGRTSALNHLK